MKACSPLLRGVTDPLAVLRVVSEHRVLLFSESSLVFYPLQDRGWVEYGKGQWLITDTGRQALGDETEPEPADLAAFFGLGGS